MKQQNLTGMCVCFTGGRHYDDMLRVTKALQKLKPSHVIVGCAPGLDALVRKLCEELNIPLTVFTADWQHLGRKAGPERNMRMLKLGKPDMLIVFPGGHGTAHCAKTAESLQIPVYRIKS